MLFKVKLALNVNNKAFTLGESLLSLFLGTILLFVVSKIFSDFYLEQNKQNELLNLQQQAHQIMDLFQYNVQHIGYRTYRNESPNDKLFQIGGNYYYLNENCLVFFYDWNSDGCIGVQKKKDCAIGNRNNSNETISEFFGFKLENKTIFYFKGDRGINHCAGRMCYEYLASCRGEQWEKMTDTNHYLVEKLIFKWKVEHQLMEISLALTSAIQPNVKYHLTSYAYIMNGAQK